MNHMLLFSTIVLELGCTRALADRPNVARWGDGVEFVFLPSDPEAGLLSSIPISTHGVCGAKGVFSDAMFGVVVDSMTADAQQLFPDTTKDAIYEGPISPIAVRPALGFTFQVPDHDLGGYFYGWTERTPLPEFAPPSHGTFYGQTFHLVADKDSPLEIVIRYRIRCADMTLSPPMSTRGQNLLALVWRKNGRPDIKPLQRTGLTRRR